MIMPICLFDLKDTCMRKILFAIFLLIVLAACGSDASPTVDYELGELIYENTFDDPNSWLTFGFVDTQFGITDGVYAAISAGGGYVSVTNYESHSNAVLEVTAEQFSSRNDTSYGIICRAQSQSNRDSIGYYFLISGSGQYGIRIGEAARIRVLVPWTDHPAINQGQAVNRIRAVCIDDYFALYINDRFVAEARHDWLEVGAMGLVVSSGEAVQIAVEFDDVRIWEAELIE